MSMIRARPVASAAIAIAVAGAAAILGAWFFQYGLGLKPCPLCLEQRYAYYFAIPLAVMVLLGDHVGASRKVLLAALVAIALGMLYNAGLGVYHSGIEWKWWAGPQECSGSLDDLAAPGGLSASRLPATTRSSRSRSPRLPRGRRRWNGSGCLHAICDRTAALRIFARVRTRLRFRGGKETVFRPIELII